MFQRSLACQGRALFTSTLSVSRKQSISIARLQHIPFSPSRCASTIPFRLSRRWQTTEATPKDQGDGVAAAPDPKTPTADIENPLQKELDAKSKEIIDLKDKYLRSVADFRNLQERTKRDMENARQFAIQRFASDLLDSIDNLDRALSSVPASSLESSSVSSSSPDTSTDSSSSTSASAPSNLTTDLQNLHNGLQMTESILMSTLKKHGLSRFDPLTDGEDGKPRKFDPRLDEATFFTAVEGKENGEVFHTQSKGFLLNGRVIRPAKVGVVKNS